jgi:DedD protein
MEFLLKQRLVGAVVLVALGVIFIPMLLEGPSHNLVPEMGPLPEPQDQSVGQPLERFPAAGEIPAEPELSVVQTNAAAEDQSMEEQPEPGDSEVLPQGQELPLALPEPVPEPEPETTPEPVKQSTAETKPADPGVLGHWVLQVGSFSSEQNALRLRDKLRKAEFATQVEQVRVGGKTHFRVRVGPYLDRAEAERDQKKLAKTFDLNGRVLSYP